jgi:HEAT repeat protein
VSGLTAVVLAGLVAAGTLGLLVYVLRSPSRAPGEQKAGERNVKRPTKEAREWLAILQDPTAADRAGAARALGDVSEAPPEVWAALAEALNDGDPDVRAAAADALGNAGDQARIAAVALEHTWRRDRDGRVRQAAREALTRVGPPTAREHVPLFCEALNDRERSVAERRLAARSLCWIGPGAAGAVADLERALSDEDLAVRDAAVLALGRIGPRANQAVPGLVKALGDENAGIRGTAAEVLGSLASQEPAVIEGLCKLLKDPEPAPRDRAAHGLGRIGKPCGARAQSALAEACTDSEPVVRVEAAAALWHVSGETDTSLKILREALAESDAPVRLRALQALRELGPRAAPALPELVELLRGAGEAALRAEAVAVLRGIGREARLAYNTLHRMTEDPDPAVQQAAAAAIEVVGEPAAADARKLVEALGDPKRPAWRRNAAEALESLGPTAAATAVPALEKALRADKNKEVRLAACGALGQMGTEGARAVDALTEALADKDFDDLREAAADSLGRIGPAAKKAVPALGKALTDDPSTNVQQTALRSLQSMGPEAAGARVALLAALREARAAPAVRAGAATVLGGLGPAGKDAVPPLGQALANDKDAEVRLAAVVALGRLGPAASAESPRVAGALGDPESADVRAAAATCLAAIGAAPKDAVPALGKALPDRERSVVVAAARALRRIATDDETKPALIGEAPPDLRALMQGVVDPLRAALSRAKDSETRIALCDALGVLRKDADRAAPDLAKLLTDPSAEVRLHAAMAHWGVRDDLDTVLRVLQDLLRADESAIRADVAYNLRALTYSYKDKDKTKLGDLGNDLARALDDAEPAVRVFAAAALWPLRDPGKKAEPWTRVVPTFIDVLEQADEDLVRVEAVRALLGSDDMLSHAKLAYPVLLALSRDDDSEEVRAAAKVALVKLKPTDGEADTYVLVQRLGDKTARWRVLAAECLRIAHPRDNKPTVRALTEVVNNDAEMAPRRAAAAALGAIGAPAADSVDSLIKALKHTDTDLRIIAAAALGQISATATEKSSAFQALKALYQNRDEEEAVRRSAAEALKKIDQAAAARLNVP